MKTVFRLHWLLCCVLGLSLLPVRSAQISWTNLAGGYWSQPSNWNPNQVPQLADDVFITNAGVYTVFLDVGASVNSLTLGGPTGQQTLTNSGLSLSLASPSVVSANGVLQIWNNGVVAGSGSLTVNGVCDLANSTQGNAFPLTVATNGVVNFLLPGGMNYIEGPLVNWGTVVWQGGGIQILNNAGSQAAVVTNEAGAVWDIQCDQTIYASESEQFFNLGNIRKAFSDGLTTLNCYLFNANGTMEADTGTIVLNGGSDLGGNLIADANAGINLGGGNYTNGPAVNFTGAGVFQMIGGNLTLLTNLIPRLQLNGGYLLLDPTFQNGAISNLILNGASLFGTNVVRGTLSASSGVINGMLTILGGSVVSATNVNLQGVFAVGEYAVLNVASGGLIGGSLNVAPHGVLNLETDPADSNPYYNNFYIQSPLTNQGTVNWTGSAIYVENDGDTNFFGAVWNEPGGIWDIQCDQYLNCYNCTANEQFHNSGTLLKTNTAGAASAATTAINVYLNNSGLVEAQDGIIQFSGGSDLGGSFVAEPAASIDFSGGNFTIDAQLGFSGAGSFSFAGGNFTLFTIPPTNVAFSGGTVSLAPSFQGGVITNLTLQGATLLGTNTVNGTLVINAGAIGGLVNVVTGSLTLNSGTLDSSSVNFDPGTTLIATNTELTGTFTVASNEAFNLASGEVGPGSSLTVSPDGIVNFESDSTSGYPYYNTYYFEGSMTNEGTVNWTGSYLSVINDGVSYFGGIWNEPGAAWDIQCDSLSVACYYCNGLEIFYNLGLLEKTVTTGTTEISLELSNSGTVEAQTGTIELTGDSNLGGSLVAETNATIELNGSFTNGPSVNFSGAGSFQMTGGTLTLVTNPIENLQLNGGNVTLGPSFQGGAITNLTLNGADLEGTNNITGSLVMEGGAIDGLANLVTGSLTLNNGSFNSSSVTINPGTTLNASNTTFTGAFTVASNAVFNWGGGTLATASSLTIAPHGVLNLEANTLNTQFYIESPLTNEGTVNWEGLTIYVINDNVCGGCQGGYTGALWNESGAVWNIQCDQSLQYYWNYGDEVFYNLGSVEKTVTTGTTTFNVLLNNSGTVEAQTGTIVLSDGGNLGGSMVAATNAAIDITQGNYTNVTAVSFSGQGSFQMNGGNLTLLTNPIPNLQLVGGTIMLASNFQGGMITNLTLDGANLVVGTNKLSGTLNVTNSLITGSLTILSGGVFNWSGGELDQSSALTVAAGGILNILQDPYDSYPYYTSLYLSSALTNAGTVVWQGGTIYLYNDNSTYFGAVWNQSGGLWNVQCDQTLQYNQNYGYDQFHNAGTFRKTAGLGTTTLSTLFDNIGILDVESGGVSLGGTYIFEPTGTLHFGINDANDYGQLSVPTNAALAGDLSVTLNNGFVPETGDSFSVFSYGSETGGFASTNLSPGVDWQTSLGLTALTLTVSNALSLEPIANQVALSTSPFTLGVTASDANVPPAILTFSLVSAPSGMTINGGTGVISWPSPSPSTNTIIVGVADNGSPPLTNSTSFVLVIQPGHPNAKPVLPVIGTQTVNELATLNVVNTATDTDPFATITYSLAASSPAGAAINASGVIAWTPSQSQSANSYTITTIATSTDPLATGNQVLTVTNMFNVNVKEVNIAPLLPILPPQTVNELTLLTVSNIASEPNIHATITGYALINPPVGATISPSGVFTWTPAQNESPSTNFITVVVTNTDGLDTVNPHLTATNTFTVVVVEVNVAPTLSVISSHTVNELTPLSVNNAAGETDIHATLAYSLVNPPAGASISSTGLVSWTPAQTQSTNTYTFTTIVNNTDIYDAVNPHLSATNTFTVLVKEVNVAPSLSAILPQTVNELTLLTVTNAATNANIHATITGYGLLNAPAGAQISPIGVFTWTPSQAESPSTNFIMTVATNSDAFDTVNPTLTSTNTFTVVVKEVNVGPALGVITTQTINELNTLTVNNAATDSDVHATLAYSLVNPPLGASVNSSGMITWTPSQSQSPSTNVITTIVTNTDGFDLVTPHLTATNSFTVIVAESNMAPVLPVIAGQTVNELTLFTITNAATEPNIHAVTTGYTLTSAPAGAAINSSGVITWTPSQSQSTNAYTFITVVSNNDLFDAVNPQRTATNSFTVTVKDVNVAPTLGSLGIQYVNELATLTVTNAATESNIHATNTGYTLVNPPAGALISSSGVITWTPSQNQSSSTNIFTTIVTNTDAFDLVNPHLTATNTFQVVVIEVNVAPAMPVIPPQTVNELTLLTVTNTATNSNIHATTTGYALLDAPGGAAINASGVITWTPAQTQSPSTNTFVVAATNTDTFDTVNPHLSSTNIFTVVVIEVNQSPTLPSIPTNTLAALSTLTVTNTATESNIHSTLSYTLVSPPAGAVISSNGIITWTPTFAQAKSTNHLTTVVTATDLLDVINPHLSATNIFTVIVTPPSVAVNSPTWLGNGQFRFTFTAASGAGYDVQSSADLIHWTTILVLDPGPGGPVTVEDSNTTTSQRFYRVEITAP